MYKFSSNKGMFPIAMGTFSILEIKFNRNIQMENKLKLLSIVFLATLACYSQDFSDLDKSPMDAVMARNTDNSPLVRVIYSKPKKRNRKVFGELVPYGEVWRTGANEATEIKFYNHVSILGNQIKPGTYTLFTIPKKNTWTFILNSKSQSWGTVNYDEKDNLLTIDIPTKKTATSIEELSISLRPLKNGTLMLLGWDDIYIEVPILKEEVKEKEKSTENELLLEEVKNKKRKKFLRIF